MDNRTREEMIRDDATADWDEIETPAEAEDDECTCGHPRKHHNGRGCRHWMHVFYDVPACSCTKFQRVA